MTAEEHQAHEAPLAEERRLIQDVEAAGRVSEAAHNAACVALRDHRARNAPAHAPSPSANGAGAVFGAVIITAEGAD
jgi:hypothetical protein